MEKTRKKARLMVTRACPRSCPNCCNKYIGKGLIQEPVEVSDFSELKEYDEILITGGEPLQNPTETEFIIRNLKAIYPEKPIYLYTTLFDARFFDLVIEHLAGVHYTLHRDPFEDDLLYFKSFQYYIEDYCKEKSFRLYIEPDFPAHVAIYPRFWSRVEIKPWIDAGECPLPEGETLLEWKWR